MTTAKEPRRNRATLATIGILLAAILFFAVNIFAAGAFKTTAIDLSQGGLYTLSPGTRSLLANLKEPITLRFYFSKRLGDSAPSYAAYAARVREMLDRYTALAHGKIRLETYNPEPYSNAEDRAVGYGLQAVPLSEGGDQVYFGLAGANSTDDEQTIPFFQTDRERFLEYDLSKLVASLANPKKPVIGLISSLPIEGSFGNPLQGMPSTPPWAITQQIGEQFTLRSLGDKPEKIDKDVDVLLIVHPKELPDKTQFAIDQFVLRGGRLLVLVDPNAEADASSSGMLMMGATSSNLPKLFDAWGVTMLPDQVAGDRKLATRVTANIEGRQRTVDYIGWLALDQDNFNHDDVVTGDLSSMLLATPGVLEKKKDATTTFTPLIQTTADATEIPADQLRVLPDFVKLLADYKPVGHPLVLAARIQGNVHTAFPDGPPGAKKPAAETPPKTETPQTEATKPETPKPEATPQAGDKAKTEPPTPAATPGAPADLKDSVKPVDIIIVADVDFIQDRLWVRSSDFFGQKLTTPLDNNGDFVLDALDSLAGSDALIGLRSRGQYARPFLLVEKIRAAADARYLAKEKELQDRLKDTEKKLASLQKEGQPGGGRQILTAEQQQELDKFRGEALDIRLSLRDVQHALRQDIERLDALLKFANIGLVPILVALIAILVALVRARRRRRRGGMA